MDNPFLAQKEFALCQRCTVEEFLQESKADDRILAAFNREADLLTFLQVADANGITWEDRVQATSRIPSWLDGELYIKRRHLRMRPGSLKHLSSYRRPFVRIIDTASEFEVSGDDEFYGLLGTGGDNPE